MAARNCAPEEDVAVRVRVSEAGAEVRDALLRHAGEPLGFSHGQRTEIAVLSFLTVPDRDSPVPPRHELLLLGDSAVDRLLELPAKPYLLGLLDAVVEGRDFFMVSTGVEESWGAGFEDFQVCAGHDCGSPLRR